MHTFSFMRLCLALLLSLFLLDPQVLAGPVEALPAQTPAPTKQLVKRGTLDDLWNSVTDANKVNTGVAKSWALKADTAAVFAPTVFYGCTLVVVVNGKGVMIGHFAREKPGGVCMDDANAAKDMVAKLETAEALVDLDNIGGTRAWIIYSDDTSNKSPGYKAIYNNLNSEDVLNIPAANIKDVTYRRDNGGGDTGKLAISWKPKDDGSGATLAVYIRSDTAVFTGTYDCNGDPVTAGQRLMARAVGKCAKNPAATFTTNFIAPVPAATLCAYHAPQPPVINRAFCSCAGKSYDLSSVAGNAVPVTASCGYTKLPETTATGLNGAPPITYLDSCQVCTPYAANGADCTSIPKCTPKPTKR